MTRGAASSAKVALHPGRPGVAQVLRIARTRDMKGHISVEIAYFVTSLPVDATGPERLHARARISGSIETKLLWRREVSFADNRCRARTRARPHASARMRALAMTKGAEANPCLPPAKRSPPTPPRRTPPGTVRIP